MGTRNFFELLRRRWEEGYFACVGLDSDYRKIPESARRDSIENTITGFNRAIVEATKDIVCAYKPNIAFYAKYGRKGLDALRCTIENIHAFAPDVPVILDAKRGDIGNTNEGYVEEAFNDLKADAITVHPYLGAEALQPFLSQPEKGIFILCRTSNKGASEFQNLLVDGEPLYCRVARNVASDWNKNGNCGLVVGATYPDELGKVRRIVGDMPILIPGIGAQGGDVKKTVSAGKDSRGQGMIINSSRGIIFASDSLDFAEAARSATLKLHEAIEEVLTAQ